MSPKTTKDQLKLQALRFFAANDYERASLNDISKALGVTKGAIYHYFDGKDDLFRSAVQSFLDIMDGRFVESLPRDIPLKVFLENLFQMEEMLVEMGEATGVGDVLVEYKNVLYVILAGLKKFPELESQLDRIYSGFRTSLVELMTTAIARGEIRRDTDTEAVAFEITAFYEGALLLGAFSNNKDFAVLGPRVCAAIWSRMAEPGTEPTTEGDSK